MASSYGPLREALDAGVLNRLARRDAVTFVVAFLLSTQHRQAGEFGTINRSACFSSITFPPL